MKTVYPNYYKDFKCIADKCRHSCCVGWEIDIDSQTLSVYENMAGLLADRFKTAISYEDTPHFVLNENKRCPFLNKNGLCDIITTLGEDALCDICALHPRFYNYYFNAAEVGLGLCCEAAAELILNSAKPFKLENFFIDNKLYTKKEQKFLSIRSQLIKIMQERNLSIKDRHSKLLSTLKIKPNKKGIAYWCDFYLGLERLDDEWTYLLNKLKENPPENVYELSGYDINTEQLTVYFLYRYIGTAQNMSHLKKLVQFSVLSTQIIMALCLLNNGIGITEYARMYSCEIEYSDENINKICQAV